MPFPIRVYRHGTTNPQYDQNGRQIDSRIWEEVAFFECVEHAEFYNAYKNNDVMSNETEQEKHNKLFYIEMYQQKQQNNFNVLLGDYLHEENCHGYWWKILGTSQQEIMPNCWIMTLRGERLSNREIARLMIKDEPTEEPVETLGR